VEAIARGGGQIALEAGGPTPSQTSPRIPSRFLRTRQSQS